MPVPNTFANVTTSIPLSNLDNNFATPITIGNTAVQLGNTVTTLNNMTLANVTISSGNTTVTSETISGNLTFTGTGNRITGDFSNATLANRVMFQTSTTNGNTVLSLLPNGTSVTAALDLYSSSSDPANSSILRFTQTSTDASIRANISGTGTYLPMTFYTGGSERMRIDTSGNVQIGTTTADGQVHIKAAAGQGVPLTLTNTDAGGNPQVAFKGSRTYQIGTGNASSGFAGQLFFYDGTAAATRMLIDSSGNVGIGTSSPPSGSRLAVVGGGVQLSGGTTSQEGIRIQRASGYASITGINNDNNAYNALAFFTGASEAARIDTSGNLLVGRTNNPGSLSNSLYVTGAYSNTTPSGANVFVNTDGSFYRSTSSLKYKTDVQDYSRGLEDVAKLRPVFYKAKSGISTEQRFAGFIAEEIEAAGLTEFVQYAEDGSPDALSYGNMVALCIKAIQEQQQMIETLQAKVAVLEGVKK